MEGSRDDKKDLNDISIDKAKAPDFTLLMTIFILVVLGIVMVYSASSPESINKFGEAGYFAKKHIVHVIIGFVGMFIGMNIHYKWWKKMAPLLFLLSLLLSGLVLAPPLGIIQGISRKGARRWLRIGVGSVGITFMPSDIMKVTSVIFFAMFLSNKKDRIRDLGQGTIPAIMVIGLSVLFIIKNDLGTSLIILGTLGAMFFVAGMNFKHIIPIAPFAVFGVFKFARKGFRDKRLTSFLDPFADKLGSGYQVIQSLYAIGSGGLFGVGLGLSNQKHHYISEAYNDFIFAIIAEETGLVGASLVLILYGVLIYRGVIIAIKSEDLFGRYLATGLTALIAIQSIIHISVVTSLIPTTGVTLPFISYGGTSLIIMMSSMGILLNISRHVDLDRS